MVKIIDINTVRKSKEEQKFENIANDVSVASKELIEDKNYLLTDVVFDDSEISILYNTYKSPCGREFYFDKDNKRKISLILLTEKGNDYIFNNIINVDKSDRVLVVDKWDDGTIKIMYDEILDIDEEGMTFKTILDRDINIAKYQYGEETLEDIPDYLYNIVLFILGTIFE